MSISIVKFSEQEKSVARLAFIHGYSNDVIADKLGLSYAAVANTLARTLRRSDKTGRAAHVEIAMALMLEQEVEPVS